MRVYVRAAVLIVTMLASTLSVSAQQGAATTRTRDGRSDLQGIWTTGTATPLERPAEFADKSSLTEAEVAEYEASGYARLLKKLPPEEIPVVGDLTEAYLDTPSFKLAGNRRTSLIVVPTNGKLPDRVPGAKEESPPEGKRLFDGPEAFDLIERFTRTDASTLSYRVTVEDPKTWVVPWTADIPFTATDERMFEFACHEANYSIANALRGARTEEKEGRSSIPSARRQRQS